MRQDATVNQEVSLLREYRYVPVIEGRIWVPYKNLIFLESDRGCYSRYVAAVGAEFKRVVFSHDRIAVCEEQETKQSEDRNSKHGGQPAMSG